MENQVYTPLAERLRPQKLAEVVGQDELTKPGGVLHTLVSSKQPASLLFWGPPGTGKTTLARILSEAWDADCVELSAVTSGLKEVREVVERAQANQRLAQRTVLFIDEIHRFNKKQQDAFLPHVESGMLTLIGATTENPSFTVNNALLSRLQVVVLKSLSGKSLMKLTGKAVKKLNRTITSDAKMTLVQLTGGDARTLYNTLELADQLQKKHQKISAETIKKALQKSNYQFDKSGDMHYDLTSAFIKSMRGSADEASLYYLHRLLAGGEDPLFIARRMVVFASEDIGMAAPYALSLAVSAFQAVERVGMPESEYILSHVVVGLSRAPKSRETTDMMRIAKQQVLNNPNAAVPLHLRNAPTALLQDLGYGEGYEWRADYKPELGFMPDEL